MSGIHVVRVGHPYTIRTYPHEGHGKIQGNERSFRMETSVALAEEHSEDAPVAVSLGFRGFRLDVRIAGGSFWRPLLAPGNRGPLGLEEFEALALGDIPWKDSPFLRAFDRYAGDDNCDAKALLSGIDTFHAGHYRKHDGNMAREHAEKAQVTAGDLLLVDGVVHVRCPEPVLLLKSATTIPYRVTWYLPRLEGDDDEFGPTVFKPEQYHGNRGHSVNDKKRREGRRLTFDYDWRVFPLTGFADAAAVATELGRRSEAHVDVDPDLVEIVRPDLLNGQHRGPAPATIVQRAFGSFNAVVTKFSRQAVMEWLDMREAKEAGDHHAVLDRMCAILDMPEDAKVLAWRRIDLKYGFSHSYSDRTDDSEAGLGGLVRYAVLDRYAPRLSRDDELALEGIDFGLDPAAPDGGDEESEDGYEAPRPF